MTEILIIVEGGVVQEVISNTEKVKVTIRDYDTETNGASHKNKEGIPCTEFEMETTIHTNIQYSEKLPEESED